jgi:hypothetical protein
MEAEKSKNNISRRKRGKSGLQVPLTNVHSKSAPEGKDYWLKCA